MQVGRPTKADASGATGADRKAKVRGHAQDGQIGLPGGTQPGDA